MSKEGIKAYRNFLFLHKSPDCKPIRATIETQKQTKGFHIAENKTIIAAIASNTPLSYFLFYC